MSKEIYKRNPKKVWKNDLLKIVTTLKLIKAESKNKTSWRIAAMNRGHDVFVHIE